MVNIRGSTLHATNRERALLLRLKSNSIIDFTQNSDRHTSCEMAPTIPANGSGRIPTPFGVPCTYLSGKQCTLKPCIVVGISVVIGHAMREERHPIITSLWWMVGKVVVKYLMPRPVAIHEQ